MIASIGRLSKTSGIVKFHESGACVIVILKPEPSTTIFAPSVCTGTRSASDSPCGPAGVNSTISPVYAVASGLSFAL